MPNIWTHMLFSEEVVDAVIDNPYSLSELEPYMKLGSQGPDPFFYYNFWPWIKNEPVHEIGMALHTEKCGAFLMDLIEKARRCDKQVQAYVFGFVTHHILDRNTHPYIHYRAGYAGSNHQKLEVLIDTLMMEKCCNLKTWKVPVYKEIDVGANLNKEITGLLDGTIQEYYPGIKPETDRYIQKAYKDMKRALKLLADPYGWKNKVLKTLIGSYSHQPIKNNIDYLNVKHATWHHPATNVSSTKSFIDLYEQARTEGIGIMTELLSYWKSPAEETRQRLADLIGNISYDTGKPLSLNLENHYSDPIV
ncbi:zinc dependent phospholipase C family protein [Virgibacillus siamensis]|uniref:zinc dependent phospholipase C family protein n=1 Tax=Virgibacillus siamensis TaxID=480071 RepID=UPI000986780B|nr:zinc dependent phospholipase C family protein [Virgibacillus siamensis]